MPSVRCPDCGAHVELPEGTQPGGLVECPNCAGHALRTREEPAGWSATLAYRVSCPACDAVITLPDAVKPGDTVRCCGQTYRLTFEFGAFAAETAVSKGHEGGANLQLPDVACAVAVATLAPG